MTDAPTCTGQLNNGPLTCVLGAGHLFGHRFEATGAPDGHTTTEDNAESSRG